MVYSENECLLIPGIPKYMHSSMEVLIFWPKTGIYAPK